jgi:hypothetical protein
MERPSVGCIPALRPTWLGPRAAAKSLLLHRALECLLRAPPPPSRSTSPRPCCLRSLGHPASTQPRTGSIGGGELLSRPKSAPAACKARELDEEASPVAANPRRLGLWAELATLTMAGDLDWEKAKAIGAGRGITGADQKGVVEVGKAPDCSKSPTSRSSVRALCRARAQTRRRSSVLWLRVVSFISSNPFLPELLDDVDVQVLRDLGRIGRGEPRCP